MIPRKSESASSASVAIAGDCWDPSRTGTVKRRPSSLLEEEQQQQQQPTATSSTIAEKRKKEDEDRKGEKEMGGVESDETAALPNRGNLKGGAGATTTRQSKIAVLRQKVQPPGGGAAKIFQKTSNLLAKTSDNKVATTGAAAATQQQKLKNNIIPPKKLVKQSTSSSSSSSASTSTTDKQSSAASAARSHQKKVSFIPSLPVEVGGGLAGGGVKSSTVKAIVRSRHQQSLSDTGVQFKELYRDFPVPELNVRARASLSDADQVNPPPLPPYRDPPPPPPPLSRVEIIQQDLVTAMDAVKNEDSGVSPAKSSSVSGKLKGLGKLISASTSSLTSGGEKKGNNYVTLPPSPKICRNFGRGSGGELPAPPTPPPPPAPDLPDKQQPSPDDILTKPEFSASMLKNLPVRQRKGAVPHLENYCLFDPSVDFFNEKEHKMRSIPETVELADPILYQNPLIYDAVGDSDRGDSDNYFTIEPESFDVEARNRLSLERVEEKIDAIFNKTCAANTQTSSSSSSGSSPDYPSMVNSVIETPSSNLESTDESDYGFRNRLIDQLKSVVPKSISGSINGDDNDEPQPPQESSYYGVVTKSAVSHHFERLHRHQQSTSLPNSPLQQRKSDESSSSSSPPSSSSAKTTEDSSTTTTTTTTLCSESLSPPSPAPCLSSPPCRSIQPASSSSSSSPSKSGLTKLRSDLVVKVNFLPLLSQHAAAAFSLESLKSSVSLPHLQRPSGAISKVPMLGATANCRNGSLDSTPLFSRLRKQRPLSNHSDADSGFLSPATPPDSTGQTIQNQILAADQQQ